MTHAIRTLRALDFLRTVRAMWPAFTAVCLLAAAIGGGLTYNLNRAPAITLRGVKEVDGLAYRGGSLDIQLRITRNRTCPAEVKRWVWQPSALPAEHGQVPRRWVQLPETGNPPTPVGREVTYILSLPLPENVTPGVWFYWSTTHDGCPWLASRDTVRESPDVPFVVVDRPRHPAVPELLLPANQTPKVIP